MISLHNIEAAKAQVLTLQRQGKPIPHVLARLAAAKPETNRVHRNRPTEELMPAPGGQMRLSINVSPATAERLKAYAAAANCNIADAVEAAAEKLEWVHE